VNRDRRFEIADPIDGPVPSTMTQACVIGVCAYNAADRIVPTLHALAAQRFDPARPVRIVVVDNNSSDGTAGVVERFARAHTRIPIEVMREPTPGKVNAMRAFFRATREPVILLTDDDTLAGPRWGESLCRAMEDEAKCGVVGGPVKPKWEFGPTRLARIYVKSLGDQDHGAARCRLEGTAAFLMGASLGLRRDAIEASGWIEGSVMPTRIGDRGVGGADDAELCYLIRRAGWEIWYEPEAFMLHRIPRWRQEKAYLAGLRGSYCRGEPKLAWIAMGGAGNAEIDADRAREEAARAKRRYCKTLLCDWRPTRRMIRLAERRGKMEGWLALAAELAATKRSASR
jgi:GT2 family glycosyltransferase